MGKTIFRDFGALLFLLALTGNLRAGVIFSDDFDGTFPGSWSTQNNSEPAGISTAGWTHGAFVTDLTSSTSDSTFAASNYETAGESNGAPAVASNWLFSPILSFHNGDELSFQASAFETQAFPDRMQVRLNVTNTGANVGATEASVGDFDRLLLDINPTYATTAAEGAFPVDWTTFKITLSGLTEPASGRFAFRYFVEDSGPSGTRGNEIGVDTVRLTSSVPEPELLLFLIVGTLFGRTRRVRMRIWLQLETVSE